MIIGKNPWSCIPEYLEASNIIEAKDFSNEKLQIIRVELSTVLKKYNNNCDVLIAGSLGRKEALAASDLDAFVLSKNSCEANTAKEILECLEEIVTSSQVDLRMASQGSFSDSISFNDLLQNYGGKKDTNKSLTRRMSLLIEGKGIDDNYVDNAKKQILEIYLRDLLEDSTRGPIFLINEIIRYYRTIAVDYEHKKEEAGKPWAVRLTKLRHSRKVLYFGALLPLLQSVKEHNGLEYLKDQFVNYTPLERIILLIDRYGRKEDWDIIRHYDTFIGFIKDSEFREKLDSIDNNKRSSDINYLMVRDNARALRDAFHNFIKYVDHWQETLWKYVLS